MNIISERGLLYLMSLPDARYLYNLRCEKDAINIFRILNS